MSRYDSSPYQINLPLQTIDLINQPTLYNHVKTESETEYSNVPTTFFNNLNKKFQSGAAKSKKEKKKVKEIDMYKKEALEKIAKKHDVSLKTKDGKIKTKEQLFKSLKRKDLLKKKMKGGEEEEFYETSILGNHIINESDKNIIISKILISISVDEVKNNNGKNISIKKINDKLKKDGYDVKDKEMYSNIKKFLNKKENENEIERR
jgi:hypothetical protein